MSLWADYVGSSLSLGEVYHRAGRPSGADAVRNENGSGESVVRSEAWMGEHVARM